MAVAINPSDSDHVARRRQQCIDKRIAACQMKIDDNDLIGAEACWRQVHDHVDPPDVNKPADVQACLDGVTEGLQAVQACVALPEKSDDEVIAKAGCLTQRLR